MSFAMSFPKNVFIGPLRSPAGGCNVVKSYDATNIRLNEMQVEFLQISEHDAKVQHLKDTINELKGMLEAAQEENEALTQKLADIEEASRLTF